MLELAQLTFDIIACDQRVTTAEELALHQTPIACEQPAVFAECALDQHGVCDHLFVRRVVAENAQPAREATEHGIGHETHDRLIGLSKHVHGSSVSPSSAC